MTQVDIHAPGVEVKKSACYFCHANCGVLAYVKDGEVIKIEALNSTPTALKSVTSEDWKNLHGDAFWKWIHDHPEAR